METYSVKQIAEMLGTNPETVRRWIRSNKLKAIQVSRKTGNIVSAKDLERFIKSVPKYAVLVGTAALPALAAVGLATSSFAIGAVMAYLESTNKTDTRIRPEDLKDYLRSQVKKLELTVQRKQALIQQTEEEIRELSHQIDQYQNLLANEDLLTNAIDRMLKSKEASHG